MKIKGLPVLLVLVYGMVNLFVTEAAFAQEVEAIESPAPVVSDDAVVSEGLSSDVVLDDVNEAVPEDVSSSSGSEVDVDDVAEQEALDLVETAVSDVELAYEDDADELVMYDDEPVSNGSDLLYSAPFPDEETSANELISLSLEAVPVGDVVSMFARTIEEANIVTGTNNLDGVVTVNVKNVPWEDALTVILDSVGLAKVSNKGNIYTIVAKDQLDSAPLDSIVLPLNYMSVEEVLPVAKQLCISEGSDAFGAPGNTLVIKETVDRLSKIKSAISEIDKPREQVFIEAKFVEINASQQEDIGVDWSILQGYKVGLEQMSWKMTDTRKNEATRKDTKGQYDIWGNQDSQRNLYDMNGQQVEMKGDTYDVWPNASGDEVQSVQQEPIVSRQYTDTRGRGRTVRSAVENVATKTLDDVKTAILSPVDFSIVLSALQQDEGTRVVSNPKIIVLNEETATINIGTREPNIATEVITADNQPTRYISALDETEPFFQFGITLDVTPTINTLSNITVRVEPTLTRYIGDKVAPDLNTFPIRSTKTIKTLFNLASGKTVAIGGLTELDNNDEEKKIPILGSIPLLGRLFSHKHKLHKQTETIIFVTVALAEPGNISPEQGLPQDTRLTRKYMVEQKSDNRIFNKELEVLEVNEQIRLKKEMEKYRKYLEKLQKKKKKAGK